MWHCATGSNIRKRTLQVLIVTSVTMCIFMMYVSNTFSSYNDDGGSMSSYSKHNSKAVDVTLPSASAGVTITKQSSDVGGGSKRKNKFRTLLKSKPEGTEIDSLEVTTLTQMMTDAIEIEQMLSLMYMNSTKDPMPTEMAPRSVKTYSGNRSKNKKVTSFSRKKDSYGVVSLNKFQLTSLRQKSMNIMLFMLPYFQTFDKTAYDIMNMNPITFNPAFKNPCWRGKHSFAPLKDGKLHCLPYFFIVGVKKSGTTDFHSRLQRHPEFCRPSFTKESQWFARIRFGTKAHSLENNNLQKIIRKGIDPRKVEFFVSMFDTAASCISLHPSRSGNNSAVYKMVTAEGSPSILHVHTNWERLPGNENLTEPRYTNFHYIKHITPKAKIIILFRDPTTRLYSDFLHTSHGKYGRSSPEVFHRHVMELIKAYKNCFRLFSQRSCVYNNTLKQELRSKRIDLADSFNAGFYAVLMKDLLAVFGKAQLLPILTSDYVTNMEKTLRNTFSFLDMSAVNSLTMRRILKMDAKNVSRGKKNVGAMLDETRDLLYDFYRPYNEDMATLMNDTRYLFPKM